jgi:hypothetical protein
MACQGTLKNGKPCQFKAKYGKYCGMHKPRNSFHLFEKLPTEIALYIVELTLEEEVREMVNQICNNEWGSFHHNSTRMKPIGSLISRLYDCDLKCISRRIWALSKVSLFFNSLIFSANVSRMIREKIEKDEAEDKRLWGERRDKWRTIHCKFVFPHGHKKQYQRCRMWGRKVEYNGYCKIHHKVAERLGLIE